MPRHLSFRTPRPMSLAVIALLMALPVTSIATTVEPKPAALAGPSSADRESTATLDLSRTTLREAARSSALASNADTAAVEPDADRAEHDTKVIALPSIRPTCSLLVGIASVVAIEAACAKNHCGSSEATNAAGALASRPVVRPMPQPAGCQPRSIKLW